MNVKKTMEHVVDNSTACGLREARPHPDDHPPLAPELGEGAAGMVLTVAPNVGLEPHDPEIKSLMLYRLS